MPYEAYTLASADEIPLDRRLVRIWRALHDLDIPTDWVFSSADRIPRYRLLIVPDAPYSTAFNTAISKAEKRGTTVIRLPLQGGEEAGLEPLMKVIDLLSKDLRTSQLPAKNGIETGLMLGTGYEAQVIVNHGNSTVSYPVDGSVRAFPAGAISDGNLSVPAHSSAWLIRACE
jgi:hypothetical protein